MSATESEVLSGLESVLRRRFVPKDPADVDVYQRVARFLVILFRTAGYVKLAEDQSLPPDKYTILAIYAFKEISRNENWRKVVLEEVTDRE